MMDHWKAKNGQSFWDLGLDPVGQTRGFLLVLRRLPSQQRFRIRPIGRIEDGADVSSYFSLHPVTLHVGLRVLL
jgi:hypothetical protein